MKGNQTSLMNKRKILYDTTSIAQTWIDLIMNIYIDGQSMMMISDV